jgi:Tfp pilus assembly protein PilO
MNTIQEYRNPLLIAGAAVIVAILLYVLVISPQSSKLSTLQTQETTLQAQEVSLQTQLNTLQTEKQKVSANCTDLEKISTQIPSVQSPSDLAAEQSSFYDQLTALVGSSGTSIPTFSWGAVSGSAAAAPSTHTPASGAAGAASPVVPVPVNMTVTGNYGQMSAFVAGLDSFPRLLVIQSFTLAFTGTAASVGSALWTGGTATPSTAGPYTLTLTGSIYYTSTANDLAACSKATTPS